MPIESTLTAPTLRLAVGTSLVFGAGQLIGWRMAFLAPILTVALLKAQRPASLGSGFGLVLAIAGICSLVAIISLPLLQYPAPALLALTLALFWTFLLGRRGAPPVVVLIMLIALTLIPLLGLQHIDLSIEVAKGLVQASLIAVLAAWIAFAVIPAVPTQEATVPDTIDEASPGNDPVRRAALSTVLVVPVLVVTLSLGLTGYALVLVFVTLLAMEPEFSSGIKGGLGLVAGNILGGMIAVAVYELAVLCPDLLFLTLLIALVCLVLGPRIFAGGVKGALCGTALTTVLLIVGTTVAPIGPDADTKFYGRIFQICVAVLYVVVSLALLELLQGKKLVPPALRSRQPELARNSTSR